MKTAEQLQQLAAWLAATDIGLLELRMPDGTVRLGRNGAAPAEIVTLDDVDAIPAAATTTASVRASAVGVFLHGHPLHAAPLLRVGERVASGQPVGLLRIGPLLLPVPAPQDGVVLAVLVPDGRAVGYGTPLVELREP